MPAWPGFCGGGGPEGDLLMPFNLMTGKQETGLICRVEEESFFSGLGDWGTHILAELVTFPGEPDMIELIRTIYDEGSGETYRYAYGYSVSGQEFWGPYGEAH